MASGLSTYGIAGIEMTCCPQVKTLTERHQVKMRYAGGRPVRITGPATGRHYHFSGVEQLRLVDPRDALIMSRNHLLRIEGIVEVSVIEPAVLKKDGDDNA
jgi:hypothetical protein